MLKFKTDTYNDRKYHIPECIYQDHIGFFDGIRGQIEGEKVNSVDVLRLFSEDMKSCWIAINAKDNFSYAQQRKDFDAFLLSSHELQSTIVSGLFSLICNSLRTFQEEVELRKRVKQSAPDIVASAFLDLNVKVKSLKLELEQLGSSYSDWRIPKLLAEQVPNLSEFSKLLNEMSLKEDKWTKAANDFREVSWEEGYYESQQFFDEMLPENNNKKALPRYIAIKVSSFLRTYCGKPLHRRNHEINAALFGESTYSEEDIKRHTQGKGQF